MLRFKFLILNIHFEKLTLDSFILHHYLMLSQVVRTYLCSNQLFLVVLLCPDKVLRLKHRIHSIIHVLEL